MFVSSTVMQVAQNRNQPNNQSAHAPTISLLAILLSSWASAKWQNTAKWAIPPFYATPIHCIEKKYHIFLNPVNKKNGLVQILFSIPFLNFFNQEKLPINFSEKWSQLSRWQATALVCHHAALAASTRRVRA